MAIRNLAVNTAGTVSESLNDQTALATAVSDAIVAADTANVSNDATTEIAAIDTALTALTANQPTGGLVVALDLSLVTTKNKLRQLLDAVYNHVASTNILT